jgi:hypothetical protein
MIANQCVNDLLKPFQGVLNALASRQSLQAQVDTDTERQKPLPPVQSIRARTTRKFHFWDRLQESMKSPDNICAEVKNLAASLVAPGSSDCAEKLLDPSQLAKNRAAFARAKATHSRLQSLEAHLNQELAKN